MRDFVRGASARQLAAAPFVIAALGAARVMVLSVPFRFYAPLLGSPASDNTGSPPPPKSAGWRARRIGAFIERLAQSTPWTSNCLVQAIVAAVVLRLLGISYAVHFGVARRGEDASALEAHSWVMAGEHPVTGFRDAEGMTCVRTFRVPG